MDAVKKANSVLTQIREEIKPQLSDWASLPQDVVMAIILEGSKRGVGKLLGHDAIHGITHDGPLL